MDRRPWRAVVSNNATTPRRPLRRTACRSWPSTPAPGSGPGQAFAGASVVQAANDKQQIEPMVEKLKALPEELGKSETLLADNGYFSAGDVTACETADIAPLIATRRDAHHPSLAERFTPGTCRTAGPHAGSGHGAPADDAGRQAAPWVAQAGARTRVRHHQVGTGFQQFLLRGLDRVRGEWSLVTMAWNPKRMFALCPSV